MSYKSSIYAYAIGHYDKNGYEKYKVGCVKNACPHKRIQDELKETLASGFIPNKILNCSFKTKKIFEDESKLFQELNKSHDITKMLNKEHFTGKNLNLEFILDKLNLLFKNKIIKNEIYNYKVINYLDGTFDNCQIIKSFNYNKQPIIYQKRAEQFIGLYIKNIHSNAKISNEFKFAGSQKDWRNKPEEVAKSKCSYKDFKWIIGKTIEII